MFAECFCVYLLEDRRNSYRGDLAVIQDTSWQSTLTSGELLSAYMCVISSVSETVHCNDEINCIIAYHSATHLVNGTPRFLDPKDRKPLN